MKTFRLTLFILLPFLSACIASATNMRGGEHVKIQERQTQNIYAAGGSITLNAIAEKDMLAAAWEIIIKDTIKGDAHFASGTLDIFSDVVGDLRIMSGDILINGNIGGDLIVMGGQVKLSKQSSVTGDVHIFGGDVQILGTITGSTQITGGRIIFNGKAMNAFQVEGGNIFMDGEIYGPSSLSGENISLEKNTAFFKDVNFFSKKGKPDFSPYMKNGATAHINPGLESRVNWFDHAYLGFGRTAFLLYKILSGSLIIAILILFFGNFFNLVAPLVFHKPLLNLGSGIFLLMGFPALIILAFLTIIGIPIGLILLLLFTILLSIGHVLTAILMAYLLKNYRSAQWKKGLLILAAILSFLCLKLLSSIPLIGNLISILFTCFAFGVLFQHLLAQASSQKQYPPPD